MNEKELVNEVKKLTAELSQKYFTDNVNKKIFDGITINNSDYKIDEWITNVDFGKIFGPQLLKPEEESEKIKKLREEIEKVKSKNYELLKENNTLKADLEKLIKLIEKLENKINQKTVKFVNL